MLTALDLRLTRAGRTVLDVPSLTLSPGAVTAIVGPNGAGKSTLFGVLAFLVTPDRGTIALDHEVVSGTAARRRVTLVEQAPLLFRGTVRSNLAFPLGHRRSAPAGALMEMAEALGIAPLLDRDARSLSGGEAQRVALARALVCRPRVLLLDEPTSAGDRTAHDAVALALVQARAAGMAVALATHQLAEAYRWSDRLIGMANGGLTTVTPENLFRTDLPAGDGVKAARCGGITIHVATSRRGPVVLAVPPEDVVLSREPLHASPRNTFTGRVVELRDDGHGRLSVTVDCGARLVARVTSGSVSELGLTIGGTVVLSIKATAVQVL